MLRRWLSVAVPVLATLSACDEPVASTTRPGVLLISLDSVRRDMLGCYGASFAGRSPSPNLDRLAAEGVVLEDARSTTSWTLPAHVTLLTGLAEFVHGVEQDGQRLADTVPTLAERLQAAGYRTAGVYSGPYLDPRFGFGRGFERYLAGYGPELARAARAAARALERVHAPAEPALLSDAVEANAQAERALEVASHRDSSSRTVTDLLLAELEAAAADERPFFLFGHYFDPHYDYVPPPPFDGLDPDYDGAVDGRDFVRRLVAPEVDTRGLAHLRALHEGELAWVDDQIGLLLAALERLKLAENTLVVVVADHGEEFLEHGSLGHRRSLYEEVLRVPLLLRLPGRVPRGARVPGPAFLSDVAPTVLVLTGLESGPAPLLAARDEAATLGRLILSPSGQRSDVAVLESFWHPPLKLLRERTLDPGAAESLRWIDLARHPEERAEDWSSDFSDPMARAALEAFRAEYARLSRERHTPALTERTDDLLAAFRGLGYTGGEARVGALASTELVLPPPGEGLPGLSGD